MQIRRLEDPDGGPDLGLGVDWRAIGEQSTLPRLGGPGVAGRGIAASRLLFLLPAFIWGKFTGGGADAAEA